MKKSVIVQKITPHLWFDKNAEEAVRFYTSVFKNSQTGKIARYPKEGQEVHGMPEGSVMTVEFQLEGQEFLALNGGPHFKFNEAISLVVTCETQEEIDYYWNKLTEGGDPKAQVCGWLKDKFGVSWQVVPSGMADMLADTKIAGKAMAALLKMKKFDFKELEDAIK
jgi:predicted 3-demethylubiquinone-9 3-methyltransferase (glyoxalase superfamily)